MRHRRHIKHFCRDSSARKALIRGLVISLVEHGRIKTTVEKAKELRRHVERAVTMGKTNSVHTKRVLLSRYPNKDTVYSLVNDLGPRFKERPGGYTRIIKIGHRPGDSAEMAFIEFVDYDFEKVPVKKVDLKLKKQTERDAEKQKKKIRLIQRRDRKASKSKD